MRPKSGIVPIGARQTILIDRPATIGPASPTRAHSNRFGGADVARIKGRIGVSTPTTATAPIPRTASGPMPPRTAPTTSANQMRFDGHGTRWLRVGSRRSENVKLYFLRGFQRATLKMDTVAYRYFFDGSRAAGNPP
jgi:hypothetical protein